jgi:hypothetical protein
MSDMNYPNGGVVGYGQGVVGFGGGGGFAPYYPRYQVPNKCVALEPFPAVQNEIVNGVLRPKNQASLVALKVIFGNETFTEAQVCYVRYGRNQTSLWAKEVLEVGGLKFIVVPETEIVLVDRLPIPAEAK